MAVDDVAAVAADADFDVTADLAAAFDAAENDAPAAPEPEPQETAEQAAERVRDEKGRFATKPDEPAAEVKPAAPKAAEPAKGAAPVDTAVTAIEAQKNEAPVARPPTSWSPTAKVLFDKIPPEVQQAIIKREEDVAKGFERYQRFKPVERFDEMARQSGTTLDRALENYVGMENRLRQDFSAGITELCQRQGIHPVALANSILARSGVSPQQGEAGQTDPQQVRNGSPQPATVDPATVQRIAALENFIQQQQNSGVQTEIERFASDPKHTFFENVKTVMGRLINSGQAESMEDAYDQACWANKEIRELLIKQQSVATDPSAKANAATQARAASKSITGSPIPNASAKGPETSIEDDIRAQFEASLV